jgi:hypothetical protein
MRFCVPEDSLFIVIHTDLLQQNNNQTRVIEKIQELQVSEWCNEFTV